jgi:alginate O-acetyltransferase complex protein AlgI
MLFNSFAFLVFFLLVTSCYFALPHRWRSLLLLTASCYFYMYFIPKYLLILAVTIVVDYIAGIYIARSQGHRRKVLLAISLVSNVGFLAFFKYFNFLNENLAAMANALGLHYPVGMLEIILPVGLSFHTFQAMSYTTKVYRGHQQPEKSFELFALYVMFYPQLVAGPIERPQNLLHQFREEHFFEYNRALSGLRLMAWGMFKKVVIADRLAEYVAASYDSPGAPPGALVVGTFFFAFQIYCDFSGYSDIARGSARVMGFHLMKNFDHPYVSRSISEFWRRWHVSLSTWFRDYLYIPLGGNRLGTTRTSANLFVTFVLSGLWHGANWTYVIWGALNGLYLIAGTAWRGIWDRLPGLGVNWLSSRARNAGGVLLTFGLIYIAWAFFRAHTFSQALHIVRSIPQGASELIAAGLLALRGSSLAELTAEARLGFPLSYFAVSFVLLALLEIAQWAERRGFTSRPWFTSPQGGWATAFVLVYGVLLLGSRSFTSSVQFIYFQF